MVIGINASAAMKQPRTGVEEYCYQLIKHLTMLAEAREHRFLLYIPTPSSPPQMRRGLRGGADKNNSQHPTPTLPSSEGRGCDWFDFSLPDNFQVRELKWPLPMWTQIRLMSHLAFHKPDILFIPVHVLPFSHPKNSVVTIHGLEYEYFPECYPSLFRNYLRWSTKYAVKHARKIIVVSENTKRDLIKFYGADESKVKVIHHGYCLSEAQPLASGWAESNANKDNPSTRSPLGGSLVQGINFPYLLFVGRTELKKNILGILDAYKILKEKYKIPHELILAGAPGFGYEKIKLASTENSSPINLRRTDLRQVKELGYVSEEEKWQLLRGADVFLFPTFYEGFGLPILEAQSVGAPVVASNNSSVSEVAGESALLVDPKSPEQIAQAVYKIIDDKTLRDKLIQLGFENVKKFSWEKCARETLNILCA